MKDEREKRKASRYYERMAESERRRRRQARQRVVNQRRVMKDIRAQFEERNTGILVQIIQPDPPARTCPSCGGALIPVAYSSADGTSYECTDSLCDFVEDVK